MTQARMNASKLDRLIFRLSEGGNHASCSTKIKVYSEAPGEGALKTKGGKTNHACANSMSAIAQTNLLRSPLLFTIAFFASCISCHRGSRTHSISVTFDYDFSANHACSPTIMTNCIAQFNVYDISKGKPERLFTIPAPSGASGPIRDIIGKSQPLNIGTGQGLLAVSAQMSGGEESNMQECTARTILP
jgi:hypothetical protein